MSQETKLCVRCNRPFSNRKRWQQRGQWEQVLYCSDRCKRDKAVRPAQS